MKTDRHHDSQITGCYVMMLVWIDGALFEGSMIALKKEKDTLSLHCIYLNVLIFLHRLLIKSYWGLSLNKGLLSWTSSVTRYYWCHHGLRSCAMPSADNRLQTTAELPWTRSLVWSSNLLWAARECLSSMGVTADRKSNRYKQLYRDPPTDLMCEYLVSTSRTPVDTSR